MIIKHKLKKNAVINKIVTDFMDTLYTYNMNTCICTYAVWYAYSNK